MVGPDKGEGLHSTSWLPAIHCPPPALPSSRLAARRRRLVVVRTHITALVTARLGQRHVSSECDLVTREARERLPVRGLTIALGSRHLFRLSVKAQCRFLPDQSSPCRACLSPPLPACPRRQEAEMLGQVRGDQRLVPGPRMLGKRAQKGPAAMPTSLAGICLLCGPGSAARTQLCLVSVRLPGLPISPSSLLCPSLPSFCTAYWAWNSILEPPSHIQAPCLLPPLDLPQLDRGQRASRSAASSA